MLPALNLKANPTRRSVAPEEREACAQLVIEGRRSAAEVARELGLAESIVKDWVDTSLRNHARDEPPLDLRARVRELERQLREVQVENEFLKRAAEMMLREQR